MTDKGLVMKGRVELLAPAGNYEAFLGAVNSGADAVYLGGDKFGARAYADNFTTEEICRAIRTAHFMGRKVYLTVNTLIKDAELEELYPWMLPVYEAGLDGVIVQDAGVLSYIKEFFKDLPIHASTQMSITGPGGALFLREKGVERIVPARELSLAEVRRLKEETGMEIECFIHGAMCCCYSGKCLFSSILGGRSGNRGTCAQPCRLPYQIYKDGSRINGAGYPLSLKDMCTITCIPQLIEAGIDSFKIEGRMKKPEYTAGVTAVYRRYIDRYEEKGPEGYRVDSGDIQKLHSLYIRSEVQTGYYDRHNGPEMITFHAPGYSGADERTLEEIRRRYVHDSDRLPVRLRVKLRAGEPALLQISSDRAGKDPDVSVIVRGDVVQPAQKMPLQTENIKKQMEKTGGSLVIVSACEIDMDGDVFLPVSALNKLRREGVEAFERKAAVSGGVCAPRKVCADRTEPGGREPESDRRICRRDVPVEKDQERQQDRRQTPLYTDILVSTLEQLETAVRHPCRRIYIESDLYTAQHEQVWEYRKEHMDRQYYLAMPYVLRARDREYLERLTALLNKDRESAAADGRDAGCRGAAADGFLIRNYESAAYVMGLAGDYEIVPDAGMYLFNAYGLEFWKDHCGEYTLPYELNAREAAGLARRARGMGMKTALIAYSRIPMMITANCIKKTAGECRTDGKVWIKDRYGTDFPVETNCVHCYNIIYNSVPYSLHLQKKETAGIGADALRYDFTTETAQECRQILENRDLPFDKHTTGHLKRGVE